MQGGKCQDVTGVNQARSLIFSFWEGVVGVAFYSGQRKKEEEIGNGFPSSFGHRRSAASRVQKRRWDGRRTWDGVWSLSLRERLISVAKLMVRIEYVGARQRKTQGAPIVSFGECVYGNYIWVFFFFSFLFSFPFFLRKAALTPPPPSFRQRRWREFFLTNAERAV